MAKLVDVGSLGSYFESLSDPRRTRNRKHLMVDIAVIAVCGLTLINRHVRFYCRCAIDSREIPPSFDSRIRQKATRGLHNLPGFASLVSNTPLLHVLFAVSASALAQALKVSSLDLLFA